MRQIFASVPLRVKERREIVRVKRDAVGLVRLRRLHDDAGEIRDRPHQSALALVVEPRKLGGG